ncbi:MAG: aminotransferase class I/II-fold pyridoxal phosphate-dependent enzyme [Thermoplasmata archaeon]
MMKDEEKVSQETKVVHGGHDLDEETRAIVPPIHLSTTFEREKDGSYPKGYIYRRSGNPNRDSLERCLLELEGGEDCAAFSSGSSAAMAVFSSLSPGDHVLAPDDLYHGTVHQLDVLMKRWGMETSYVDMTDPESVEDAIRDETKLIWIETPSNPLLKVTDIEGVCEIACERGVLTAVDNTWSTSVIQRPLALGADLVVYSTTKYFGGHSDVVGGAVICGEDGALFERIRDIQIHGGATPSPFDCWLTRRGIKTLGVRMERHCENALRIAEFLEGHDSVERVYYPGLESHPGHDVARKQMEMYGGMLSFQVKGGEEEAFEVAAGLKVFTRATSLGSVESLVEHRSSIEGEGTKTPGNLLRLSVGIEDVDDLVCDLEKALAELT